MLKPRLNILNLDSRGPVGSDLISISKSIISIPLSVANRLGFKKDDYILVATLGTNIYMARRPKNFFGGHKMAPLGNSSARYALSITAEKYNLPIGGYSVIYDKPIEQEEEDVHGNKHTIIFYELTPE